jgi:hypothetical protein
MNKKELIKILTDNFDKTQNKLIEQTIKDIVSLLNMVEAINLIKTCSEDKEFLLKVSDDSLDMSLDYYLRKVIDYCLEIKSSIESIEISTNLLIDINDQKNNITNKGEK